MRTLYKNKYTVDSRNSLSLDKDRVGLGSWVGFLLFFFLYSDNNPVPLVSRQRMSFSGHAGGGTCYGWYIGRALETKVPQLCSGTPHLQVQWHKGKVKNKDLMSIMVSSIPLQRPWFIWTASSIGSPVRLPGYCTKTPHQDKLRTEGAIIVLFLLAT